MSASEERMDMDFVRLRDGRLVSYRELGCSQEEAKRSLLVLHGWGSSRIAAIPGISVSLLREFGVRLVAIDRPGYGHSDPAPSGFTLETAARDVEDLIDRLELGEEVWLLGFSGGGATCWAAARYIPHRIRGIALWTPVGYYWWKGITDEERELMFSKLSPGTTVLFSYLRHLPHFLVRLYARFVLARRAGERWVEHCMKTMCEPDQKHLKQLKDSQDLMLRDNLESISFNKAAGLAKDLEIFTFDWGFEIDEVASNFKGPIHIWQGTEDNAVPLELQKWIKSKIPDSVTLHELPGEGHLSWFCFNDDSHRQVFQTLFSDTGGVADAAAAGNKE